MKIFLVNYLKDIRKYKSIIVVINTMVYHNLSVESEIIGISKYVYIFGQGH